MGGGWIYRREKGKVRRKLPVKLVLHQWLGRTVAILGIIQVPLGLALYGSPKYTFILYTLWMTFLLVLYFVLSYRAMSPIDAGRGVLSSYGGTGTIIPEKKKRGWLGPLAAGAGIAAILARRRSKKKERERSRSRSRSRLEVIPSRRGSRRDSGSYIEEEKYERHDEGGGFMSKLLKGGAIVGAGALAKNWYDRRQKRKQEDDYSSVAPDTPSKRHGRHARHDSVSSESISVHRMEEGRRPGAILPGPGDPIVAAAAISAAERPSVPRPARPARRHSFDSSYYTDSLSSVANSPSRRPQSTHKLRNTVLAGVGLGWAAKKWKDRSKKKEEDRLDRLEEDHRIEEERRRRHGQTPTKFTGDGHPSSRRHGRRPSYDHASDYSSVVEDVHTIRPGAIPPIPSALVGGLAGAAMASGGRSSSHHNIASEHPGDPPTKPHFPQAESGSEQYYSSGGAMHRRHSSRRRREGEAAAEAAAAAGIAAEEEARRRRSRSRDYSQGRPAVTSPPVSVKVKMHGDKDRNVTLRRLTEQEAAAEREARRSSRRRRADSLSSLSGTDTNPASNRRRYRRDRREDELAAEKRSEAGMPPPSMKPLSPPNPAFAAGRKPKDSAYYSGKPEGSGIGGGHGPGSVGSPESHGTWSAMSPVSGSEDPAERRRRRRLERNQRPSGTMEFT